MYKPIEIVRKSLVLKPVAFEQFATPQSPPQEAPSEETLVEASLSAKAQADKILEEASVEAENLKRTAYEEGYKAGFAQGHEEGQGEFLQTVESLGKLHGELSQAVSQAQREFFETIEGELIELVLALTKKVVYKEIASGETIQNLVKRALQLVGEEKRIVIRLHPEDLNVIKENGFQEENPPSIPPFQRGEGGISLIPAVDIERGGCFVEAGKKVVDARLETRLEEMAEALYGVR